MKNLVVLLWVLLLVSCKSGNRNIIEVANFTGQQVTGVTVSEQGRVFANFPRWRKAVKNSVVEVDKSGQAISYPNKKWNSWTLKAPISDSLFVAVQSVVAFENNLYVLDTRNPLFKGVIGRPRIFVFNLDSNKLIQTYMLSEASFHGDSYINDLRIDKKNKKAYMTDSGHAGLIILDLESGMFKRVLDNHFSTSSELEWLSFDGIKWVNTVHSDGIALDIRKDLLYYHSLTGYSLFAVPTSILINGSELEIHENIEFIKRTPAPDGMIFDSFGNLYLADLEKNRIMRLKASDGKLEVFAEGEKIKWADTFSVYNDELYFTNSRINEATGAIDTMVFTINKIKID